MGTMTEEIEMNTVICRCGLTFRVSVGVVQEYHSMGCRTHYEDKINPPTPQEVWRRTNMTDTQRREVRKKLDGK